MGKKKEGEKAEKKVLGANIDEILKDEFGDTIFKDVQSFIEKPPRVVSFSPALDLGLGGGVPEGSMVILTGPPKIGKSCSALQLAANAQKKLGSKVYYLDIEGRIKPRDLSGIKDLNASPDCFKCISSDEGNILTGEKYISIAEKLINAVTNAVVIIDSFSAICTSARYSADIADRFRDDAPLLIASFCKRIANVIPVKKVIVVGITHLIANQSPMAKSMWMEASGQKIQYSQDVKLRATHKEFITAGEANIGQKIHWVVDNSAIGGPGMKIEGMLRYGHGLDKERELLDVASDVGLINKSGNWYSFEEGGQQFNGAEQARNHLVQNPSLYEEIYEKVREALGFPK